MLPSAICKHQVLNSVCHCNLVRENWRTWLKWGHLEHIYLKCWLPTVSTSQNTEYKPEKCGSWVYGEGPLSGKGHISKNTTPTALTSKTAFLRPQLKAHKPWTSTLILVAFTMLFATSELLYSQKGLWHRNHNTILCMCKSFAVLRCIKKKQKQKKTPHTQKKKTTSSMVQARTGIVEENYFK